jgi:hypothetical protein
MKKVALYSGFIIFIGSLIGFSIFEKSSHFKAEESDTERTSKHDGEESHNVGRNCMNCHFRGGPGKVWFSVAGTVYKDDKITPNPNGTIKLYTGPKGTGELKERIEVDAFGNFYTTKDIDFGSGLYPVVIGTTGNIKIMGFLVPDGQCNSCHDEDNRIWID